MLKKALAGTLACFAPAVFAQESDSLKLYGVLDIGVAYISNQYGKSAVTTNEAGLWGSRFGLTGVEDLGRGYNVFFDLQSGFNLSSGKSAQGGRLFGRRSVVGLGTPFGKVSMGRDYDFVRDYLNPLNIGGYASVYSGHHGDFDHISGVRFDRTVRYTSPNFNGFTFGMMYAFGDETIGQTISAGAGYKGARLTAGVSYVRSKNTSPIYPWNQGGVTNFLGGTYGDFDAVSLDKKEIVGAGGGYDFGPVRLVANLTTTEMVEGNARERQRVYEFGAQIPVTKSLTAFAAWQHSRMSGYRWNQPTVGAWYHLSKRTFLYTSLGYLKASKGVNANQGAGFYFQPSDNNRQAAFRSGIVHTF